MNASDLARPLQKFSFGYEIITWDIAGEPLGPVLDFLAKQGFRWYESLLGDSLGEDFSRRTMTLGGLGLPERITDVDLLDRLAFFGRSQLDHDVSLASLFVGGEWMDESLWPHERAKAEVVTRFLHSCGAPTLVLGGGPPEPARTTRTVADYAKFARRLGEIGGFANSLGVRAVYHPHIDTFIETRDQLDRFMDVLDTGAVGLCLDPAHFQVMGDDPVSPFDTYGEAVDYVHLKDAKGDVGRDDGHARYRAFCELGKGVIDLPRISETLLRRGYDGLVIIELDYSATPNDSCETSVDYVHDTLGLELFP